MTSAKPICTPLIASTRLSGLNTTQSESKKEYMSRVSYASVVGNLMYVMVCTRSNLEQAISVMSSYMGNPGSNICRL